MRGETRLAVTNTRFEIGLTLNRSIQLAVAVQGCRNTDQARIIIVASFHKSLACWYLCPERPALWPFGVIINRVWSLAEVVRYRGHLDVVVGHPIPKHDGCEVDSDERIVGIGRRHQGDLPVLVIYHTRDVRRIRATVTLGCEMEGKGRVLRETREEEFQERIHVLARDWAGVDGTSILDVRVSYINGLVEEYNVGIRVPAIRVRSRGGAVIGNATGAKLEEKTCGGAAARATIKPQDDGRILGRVSGLKEPGKSSSYHVRWTAERGLG